MVPFFFSRTIIIPCFKIVRLNSTQYFVKVIPNKRELQHIAINFSSDIEVKGFYEALQKIYW